MLRFIRQRRERHLWACQTAADLVRQHGPQARNMVLLRMAERIRTKQDIVLETLVKREIDRMTGARPHVDTATRMAERDRD